MSINMRAARGATLMTRGDTLRARGTTLIRTRGLLVRTSPHGHGRVVSVTMVLAFFEASLGLRYITSAERTSFFWLTQESFPGNPQSWLPNSLTSTLDNGQTRRDVPHLDKSQSSPDESRFALSSSETAHTMCSLSLA